MSTTIKLADYLFRRLRQLGIGSVHGVPGDYNLELLDYVEPNGLLWVGNANELNAGYAADGYSRIKGVGAIITTFGVGELSAINAIACAYAERAAVVHIVGTPARDCQDRRLNVHHTLGDGNYRHFAQMQSHVTVAQVSLRDVRTSTAQIDEALKQCILQSRPVYIEVPVDMVTTLVPADRLDFPIESPDTTSIDSQALQEISEMIRHAARPVILIDNEARGLRILEEVESFVKSTQWPTFTSGSAKGLIDMTLSNVHGVYTGKYANASTRALFDEADLVICFGPSFCTTNSYNGTAVPDLTRSILFTHDGIKVKNHQTHHDISVKTALTWLLDHLSSEPLEFNSHQTVNQTCPLTPAHDDPILSFSDVSPTASLKHDKLWTLIAPTLREGDVIMGETGTSGYGVCQMRLPRHARLFTPSTWLSIGYMTAAAQGVALALREISSSPSFSKLHNGITNDSIPTTTSPPTPQTLPQPPSPRRTLLFTGDGSFQMTCQELSTAIRHHLPLLIFLLNNDGYTIERAIHGPTQRYNDVGRWRYRDALRFFGAQDEKKKTTRRVTNYGELKAVLEDEGFMNGEGVRMVELVMGWDDVPEGPLEELMAERRREGGMGGR